MDKKFFNIQLRLPFRKCILYADMAEHLGTVEFFRENGISIKGIKGEFEKPGTPYVFICAIWRGKMEDMEKAIDKLDDKFLLTGHKDLIDFRNEMFEKFQDSFDSSDFSG